MTPTQRHNFNRSIRTSTPAQLAMTQSLLEQAIAILLNHGQHAVRGIVATLNVAPQVLPLENALAILKAHRATIEAAPVVASPTPAPLSPARAATPVADSLF